MTIRNIVLKTARWAWVFLLGAIMVSYLAVSGVTRHLQALTRMATEIARGNFAMRPPTKGRDEVAVLSRAVGHMSAQIQLLLKAKVEAARQEKELETARIVQETLLPKSDIRGALLWITGHCSPATECGGDWWGHFESKEGLHYVLIADATGHGAAAAIVTAMAHSSCMMLAESCKQAGTEGPGPGQVLATLNRILWETGKGATTMTFLVMVIDPRRGEMRFASAGHCMPYLVPAEDTDERLRRNRRHVLLKCRGMPLGYAAESDFEEQTVQLKAGEKLFLYTDGLIECVNAKHTAFGKRHLEMALNQSAELSAAAMKTSVLQSAFQHFGDTPLNDDVTLVVVEIFPARDVKGGEALEGADRKAG